MAAEPNKRKDPRANLLAKAWRTTPPAHPERGTPSAFRDSRAEIARFTLFGLSAAEYGYEGYTGIRTEGDRHVSHWEFSYLTTRFGPNAPQILVQPLTREDVTHLQDYADTMLPALADRNDLGKTNRRIPLDEELLHTEFENLEDTIVTLLPHATTEEARFLNFCGSISRPSQEAIALLDELAYFHGQAGLLTLGEEEHSADRQVFFRKLAEASSIPPSLGKLSLNPQLPLTRNFLRYLVSHIFRDNEVDTSEKEIFTNLMRGYFPAGWDGQDPFRLQGVATTLRYETIVQDALVAQIAIQNPASLKPEGWGELRKGFLQRKERAYSLERMRRDLGSIISNGLEAARQQEPGSTAYLFDTGALRREGKSVTGPLIDETLRGIVSFILETSYARKLPGYQEIEAEPLLRLSAVLYGIRDGEYAHQFSEVDHQR